MHRDKTARLDRLSLGIAAVLVGLLVGTPALLYAQAGANAAIAPNGSSTVASVSFVDASAYVASGTDICTAINTVLNAYNTSNSNGVVIDARGVTTLTCSSSNPINPWDINPQYTAPYNNTVLLPTGTIKIYKSWTLPSDTHLIGQGSGLTIIQAGSAISTIINMGGSGINSPQQYCKQTQPSGSNYVWDCVHVVIEHLGLNAGSSNGTINGIVNQFSQELSYVNDVAMTNITGTGLMLGGGSEAQGSGNCTSTQYCVWSSSNSGPYTNISVSGNGTCVSIIAGAKSVTNQVNTAPLPLNTRGVHGLTCNMTGSSACTPGGSQSAAICLDAPNNSLEDVSISTTSSSPLDGILIGDISDAQANVLSNISGSGLKNLIHISSNTTPSGAPPSLCMPLNITNPPNACDETVIGASKASNVTNIVQDDLTGTTLTDSSLSMYMLGEMLPGGVGYSRFTTSPNLPSWSFGPNAIPVNQPCNIVGSLYSQTSGTTSTGSTVYGCQGQPAPNVIKWVLIPAQ